MIGLPFERCSVSIHPSIKRAFMKRHGRALYRSLSIYLKSIDKHLPGHVIRFLNYEFELDEFEVVGFSEFDIDDLENEVLVYSFTINNNNQSKG